MAQYSNIGGKSGYGGSKDLNKEVDRANRANTMSRTYGTASFSDGGVRKTTNSYRGSTHYQNGSTQYKSSPGSTHYKNSPGSTQYKNAAGGSVVKNAEYSTVGPRDKGKVAKTTNPYSGGKQKSFSEKFAEERAAGNRTFSWNGRSYTTALKGETSTTRKAAPKAVTKAAPKAAPKAVAKPTGGFTAGKTTKSSIGNSIGASKGTARNNALGRGGKNDVAGPTKNAAGKNASSASKPSNASKSVSSSRNAGFGGNNKKNW